MADYTGFLYDSTGHNPLIGIKVQAHNATTGVLISTVLTDSTGKWDFGTLTVIPTIYAYIEHGIRLVFRGEIIGSVAGNVDLMTSGALRINATGVLTGDGAYIDYNAGTPRLRVGTVSGGALAKGIYWDGTNLAWIGVNTSLTAAGLFTATDAVITGTITASAGSFTGVVNIGASGGIFQGTGTFAVPTTALKIYSSGGVGLLEMWGSGTKQVYMNTDGKLYAAAGFVWLDSVGVGLDPEGGGPPYIRWARTSGAVESRISAVYNAGHTNANWETFGDTSTDYARVTITAKTQGVGLEESYIQIQGGPTLNGGAIILNVDNDAQRLDIYAAGFVFAGGNIILDALATVDGVDVSVHKAGTAKAQHTAGMGDHTHQSAGAEGAQLDHGLALTGLGDDDHTQYLLATGARAGSSSQAQSFGATGLKADVIAESTAATGVTIDSVLLKDGLVDGQDISARINQDVLTTSNPTFAGAKFGSSRVALTTNNDKGLIQGLGDGHIRLELHPSASYHKFTVYNMLTAVDVITLEETGDLLMNGALTISGQSRISVYRGTSVQAIVANTDTKVQFNAETFDNLGEFDSTTNYRFTATQAGIYLVHAQVLYANSPGSQNYYQVKIMKNGVDTKHFYMSSTTGYRPTLAITSILSLAVADYIEINVYNHEANDISATSADTYLDIVRVG